MSFLHTWDNKQLNSNIEYNIFIRYIDGLVQNCSNSIDNALGLLQFCPKPSICMFYCSLFCFGYRDVRVGFTRCISLQWRHNEHHGVSNHQPHNCLLNRLFSHRSKKTSKLRVTGLCAGKSPATGKFPAKRATNAENVSIWWRHHAVLKSHIVSMSVK